MAQAQLQEEQIPSGGIADFVMSEEEIAALEAEEAKEQFGTSGIARFEPIAQRMASYGRYGDDRLAHVETGELLVPKALIEQNPKLKESIFNHLREMGIEDPDRYVVGSSENSINPDTGLPEFFLNKIFKGVSKAVSGIAKGVSKVLGKVGKVLKKVAPVVLPIALAMTPLGPMYGAALGSGIGTLIQGGNIKDALKSALVSGAVGGITAGFTGKGSFMSNVGDAMKNPLARLSQTGSAITSGNPFQSFTAPAPTGSQVADDIAAGRLDAGVAEAQELAGTTPMEEYTQAVDYSPRGKVPLGDPNVAAVDDPFFQNADGTFNQAKYDLSIGPGDTQVVFEPGQGADYRFGGTGGASPENVARFAEQSGSTGAEKGFFDRTMDSATEFYNQNLSPSRGMANIPTLETEIDRIQTLYPKMADDNVRAAAEASIAKQTPGIISQYGPLAAVGTAGAAGLGFFTPAEVEDPNLVDRRTGAELIAEDRERYVIPAQGITPRQGQRPTVVGTDYGYTPRPMPMYQPDYNPFVRPEMMAAAGGEVYPRRNGGIMPNEGIPDQDSVRALLMPGEFVMTKNAVRGLGNGNLNQGINNMYSMMRNLEAKGQVA